jgi:hypothetical protein
MHYSFTFSTSKSGVLIAALCDEQVAPKLTPERLDPACVFADFDALTGASYTDQMAGPPEGLAPTLRAL